MIREITAALISSAIDNIDKQYGRPELPLERLATIHHLRNENSSHLRGDHSITQVAMTSIDTYLTDPIVKPTTTYT